MIDRRARWSTDALAARLDPELHRLGGGDGARWYAERARELGLAVQWQQVEDGRANVLGDLRRARAAGRR